MIAYVDTGPAVELHNGIFVLTATSGKEEVQIAFTPFAFGALLRAGNRATRAFFGALEAEVKPLHGRQMLEATE